MLCQIDKGIWTVAVRNTRSHPARENSHREFPVKGSDDFFLKEGAIEPHARRTEALT